MTRYAPSSLSLPLVTDRNYYLHTGDIVGLCFLHPLYVNRPIRVGRVRRRRFSERSFRRLVNWPLTRAHWVVECARYDPATGRVAPLPDGWGARIQPSASTDAGPTIILTDPEGFRFRTTVHSRQPTILSDLTPLIDALTPEPAQAVLGALLGGRFHCHVCGSRHLADHPDQWRACSRSPKPFDRHLIPGERCQWTPDVTPYRHRAYHYDIAHPHWRRQYGHRFHSLLAQLDALILTDHVPAMTADELADPHGLSRYYTRAATWRTHWLARIVDQRKRAQPLLDQLEQILPMLHPVGPPIRTPDQALDGRTVQEFNRVASILRGQGPVEEDIGAVCLILRGHGFGRIARQRIGVQTAIRQVETLFRTWIYQWTHAQSELVLDPNSLGLDPAFWNTISICRGTMTLTTNPIQSTRVGPH